jgi:hypothetical protein
MGRWLQGHKGEYEAFLGENVDDYLNSMEKAGTWGDELTLVRPNPEVNPGGKKSPWCFSYYK